jgi:DNA-binding GntR family transcriptional regulator
VPGGSSPAAEIRPVVGCVWLAVGSRGRAEGFARYAHVADELRAAIVAGRFPPGARLPSERALADEFGVSRATIVSAFHLLRGQGLIETRRGTGSWATRRP